MATNRAVLGLSLMIMAWPVAAQAQEKCGTLKLLNHVQMIRAGNEDLVPVTVNGTPENFLFDTGGALTQISRPTAEALKLTVQQGNIEMFDANGNVSRDQASAKEFMVGNMRGADQIFPITPEKLSHDGIFALDHWTGLDVDVDFGTDMLNMISQDHCDGKVIYWNPSVAAVVPIHLDGYHIIVPVTIDGKPERALIDTGASGSVLLITEAKRLFDIDPGGTDTPENGVLNGDPSLKTYSHQFKSMSFGDVAVNNPQFTLIPDEMGKSANKVPLGGSRITTERDLLNRPDMAIGMNVLRKLHIYIAFGEQKMYISPASVPAAPAAASATPSNTPAP